MRLSALVFRRAVHALAVVLLATVIAFVVIRAMPGDPFAGSTEQAGRSQLAQDRLRSSYGFDKPIAVQFTHYVSRVATGNLGISVASQRPVSETLAPALRRTVLLCGSALFLAVMLGLVTGAWQGWSPRSPAAAVLGRGLTSLYAVPEFIIAVVLIAIFALRMRMLPVGGIVDPIIAISGTRWEQAIDVVRHLVLPSMTLALGWGAIIARQQRVSLMEIRSTDFIRTARAKGVRGRAILLKHALPHALTGVVSVTGFMLPATASGALVVETLYSWPGMGTLLVQAIIARDYPVVSGAILVIASTVAGASMITEVFVLTLDPRRRTTA
jgi:peptide/nickel transport system permease protein